MATLSGKSTDADTAGVFGEGQLFNGVRGVSHGEQHAGVGGVNDNTGDKAGPGVWGVSRGTGVRGDSSTWHGIAGISTSTTGGAGLYGDNQAGGPGIIGMSKNWHAIYGKSESTKGGAGVWGEHETGVGVVGRSTSSLGIYGVSETGTAIQAETKSGGRPALLAKGSKIAGRFEGDVEVTGDIRLVNADCAEDFDVSEAVEIDPGTVMVLADDSRLCPSNRPYDKRVAGVVSGAGDFKPGIVLDKQSTDKPRQPIALLGKVFCKVDARFGAIEVGDLLTTSPTQGHAMKAGDPFQAFGSIIGKALRSLPEGQGLIPILVALQ